jgi:hypothetical protein
MKKLSKLLLCLQSIAIFSLHANAQPPGEAFKKLASVPLQTPQAASLSRYVEYPVSYYNGLAQISIPVYEVVCGDITVPISLSYHGSGIRVQEEASWVGLGWTLNAGGVIIHDVKGRNDEVGFYHSFNQVLPSGQLNNYVESPFAASANGCPSVYTNTGTVWTCSNLSPHLNGGYNVDGEPDMYAYNFGEYSGKFFYSTGGFVDMSHNNIQFTALGGTGFIAITPDGYKYEFMAVEKAWSYPVEYATNTAYYLTKITSPRGKTVTFQYKSFKQLLNDNGVSWSNQYSNLSLAWGPEETIMQSPSLTESFSNYVFTNGAQAGVSIPPSAYGHHQNYSSTTSTNLYLDRITFDLGWVDFIKSPRTDMYGVKLDAINVSRGPLIKSIPFTYDYFVSNTGDDDMYDPQKVWLHLEQPVDAHVLNYPPGYRNRRLKLLSVAVESSAHNFEYYEGDLNSTLPYKTSFAQDYWGFFNGKRGNPSLIPDFDIYSQQRTLVQQLSSWQGANRNPDDNYIRAGSLKRIVYPTGGFSQFNYEMNEWYNLSSEQLYSYRQARYGGIDAGTGNQKFYFTITTNTYCDITGGLYCNEMLDMNSPSYNCGCGYICTGGGPNALYAVIDKVDPTTHAFIQNYPDWQFDITKDAVRNGGGGIGLTNQFFAPGTYCITVNYPDNHNPPGNIPYNRRAELYVSFYEQIATPLNAKATGAGLRIGSIKNFDPVGMQLMERKFTYTGGKIMRYPVFNSDARQQYNNIVPMGDFQVNYVANYRFYYLYSTPAFPLSTSANGSLVGYDMVTEAIVGPSSIGKTQYEYKNRPDNATTQPDVYMPGTPSTGFLDNGFLNREAVYDKNNTLLKETLNTQLTALSATYWPFKCRIWSTDQSNTQLFSQYLEFCFYPMQVGKILNFITTVKDYANGTSLNTARTFSYNSNGLLSQESTTASDGSTLITSYNYASDYTGVSSGWIQDMKDKNMVNIPLEVYNKRNGLVTGGVFTTYLNHDNIMTPDKVYEVETTFPKSIASTVPNGTIPADLKLSGTVTYDAFGNMVQSQADNDVYTSYLWAYSKTYPVAKVVGVDYATINNLVSNFTVNPAVLSNPYIPDAQLNQELNNLRTALAGTKAIITTYTYAPLIGMSTQTDAKGLITYYNYDSYNRLLMIRDQQNNILKYYSYYYAPGLKTVANSLFFNQETTKFFNKQCGLDAFGRTQVSTEVPYTVPAGKYVGISQLSANESAMEEVNTNGQANANLMADCFLYGGPLELVAIENGSGTNLTVKYKCPFFANFYCFIFIQDVATGQYVGGSGGPMSIPVGQTTYTFNNIPKNKEYRFWLQAQGSSYYSTSPQTVMFLP